jgi:hypothetical protein
MMHSLALPHVLVQHGCDAHEFAHFMVDVANRFLTALPLSQRSSIEDKGPFCPNLALVPVSTNPLGFSGKNIGLSAGFSGP